MLNINSYLIKSVRHFIEDKCFEGHKEDSANSPLRTQVLEKRIPATTGFCIQSNQCLLNVIGHNSEFKLVGGYALNSEMKPSECLRKTYCKGKTEPERRYGWIWDFKNDVAYGLHWWLQSNEAIIDIAADQFGHPTVIIAKANDERYIIGKDDDEDVHSNIATSIDTGNDWAKEYLSLMESHFVSSDRVIAF